MKPLKTSSVERPAPRAVSMAGRPAHPGRQFFAVALGLGLAGLVAVSSCAPDSGFDPGTPDAGTAGSGGIGEFDSGSNEDALPNPDAACGLITEQGTATPVNLYIMLDKSQSMVGTKWDGAKAGLAAFVNDPASEGVRVALRFFPRDPDAVPACDQAAYAPPIVDFAPLPQNAAPIIDAVNAETPSGFSTPIYPALGGAILKSIEVAENNPGERSAVLLITDGAPEGPAPTCGGVDPEDPAVIAALAAAGVDFDPPVLTFVVGLPGVNQAFANQVAVAGGTDAAILVSNTNVEVEFQNALSKVRGKAVSCEYQIPEQVTGGEVDPFKVNILVTAGGSTEPVLVPFDPDCAGQGWRYDDPASPTKILLCPETCAQVRDDFESTLQVLLGCETEVVK
jgi:hypothetical protein